MYPGSGVHFFISIRLLPCKLNISQCIGKFRSRIKKWSQFIISNQMFGLLLHSERNNKLLMT